MRSYYDAGHLAGIAQQALLQMDSMSLGDRIIKTEPEEDSPMSGMSPCGPSHTDAYFAPGSSIIKAEPEEDSPMSGIPPWKPSHTDAYFALRPSIIKTEPQEDSPMSGLNGLPPTNPSNPPEFGPGGGGFHANHWEDWLSQRQRNHPREQPVQHPSDDDDDDEDPLASWLSLAATPDPFPRDIKVEEEARVIEVLGNTLSAWGLPASQYNMGYEYSWPSTPRGLSEPVFYGTVHEEHSYEATERAREIHGAGSSLSHVVMWTGASAPRRTHDGVGYAVASLFNGEGWRVMCRREGHSIGSLWMSLQSIALAIEVALQHVTLWQPTPFVGTTVRIFTSDTAAIKALKTLPLCAMNMSMIEASQTISVLEEIAAMSRYLSELGATLEVFWAPRAKHPGYRVARAASVYARSTPDGRSQESWAFPDKGVVVEALNEDASANIKAEVEEKVKTKVKAEFKVEIKAQVKDDDDDMSSLDLKTEKDFEVESKWWQRLSCC